MSVPTQPPAHIIICQSLDHPNDKLVGLLLAIQTLRAAGVKRVSLVAPYLCYMRQDKAFHPGEAISQKIIGRLLADLVDDLITVDAHLHRVDMLQQAVPLDNAINLSAAPALGEFGTDRTGRHVDDPNLKSGPNKLPKQVALTGQLPINSVTVMLRYVSPCRISTFSTGSWCLLTMSSVVVIPWHKPHVNSRKQAPGKSAAW